MIRLSFLKQDGPDAGGEEAPLLAVPIELCSAGLGQGIDLARRPVLLRLPVGRDEPIALQLVEGGIKLVLAELEHPLAFPLDLLRDRIPVERPIAKGA